MNARPLFVLAALAAVTTPGSLDEVWGEVRAVVKKDPMGSVLGTVLTSSYLFFVAENGVNPKVRTFSDALVYVTTCLSVGYHDIFPQTEAGKLIAATLMTYGPALSAQILDAPEPA